MHIRVELQLAEALGPVNRWFCSQAYGTCVEDPERLWHYFIKSGGAIDFARRFNEALSQMNRWYCSQYYGYDVSDTKTLWNYYMNIGLASARKNARSQPDNSPNGCNIAC